MKTLIILLLLAVLTTGCLGATKGEGLTLNSQGLTIGPSQQVRDEIAQDRATLESEILKDESAARIDQMMQDGSTRRDALMALALAAMLGLAVVSLGFAGKLTAPLAGQGVEGLRAALELRRSKRLEISVEVGSSGYVGHLLAEGYDRDELLDLVRQNPALDAPKVLALQDRVGDRGVRLLVDRGELEETLALLPEGAEVVE